MPALQVAAGGRVAGDIEAVLHLGARHRARKEGAGRATGANRLLQRKGEFVLGLRDHEIARPARARMRMAERRWGWSTMRPSSRSEEHTSELQSLMRISYAVFCLKTTTSHLQVTDDYKSFNTQNL